MMLSIILLGIALFMLSVMMLFLCYSPLKRKLCAKFGFIYGDTDIVTAAATIALLAALLITASFIGG